MPNLSKSKILAYRQCPKRLWLEIHRPDLRDDSASEMAFAIGNRVGEIARTVFDPSGKGTLIDIAELGHAEALSRSAARLSEGSGPIFEAGVTASGALAYTDVMLPDFSAGTLRWHMIEVKAAASVKQYHHDDIAVQSFIAAAAGVNLASISLAHIDSSFVYPGGNEYSGLFRVVNLTEQSLERHAEVRDWIAEAHQVASLTEEPEIAPGNQCWQPYACGFCKHCHQEIARPKYPLSSLPNLSPLRRARIEADGIEDLRDVPDHLLTSKQQLVKHCSISGETSFNAEGAAAELVRHGDEAYFLDFETIALAVPRWPGSRPYQPIPFQFSLHHLRADGTTSHEGFLDLSGDDPSRPCAEALIRLCGSAGAIFAYNASFEADVIRRLAAKFPDWSESLQSIASRLVDLHPIAKNHYYHPSQHGKWGLKSVLPALCPDLSYDDLDGVQDGQLAQQAYQEAINLQTTPERREQLHHQLHAYCKLDTLALIRIWQLFRSGA